MENKQNRVKEVNNPGVGTMRRVQQGGQGHLTEKVTTEQILQGGERGPREPVGRLCLILYTSFIHSAEGLYYWHLLYLQPSRTTGFPKLP